MKALLSLAGLLLGMAAGAAGISHLDLNGNSYSNITDVHIGVGNLVIILYPGGGTSARVDAVPADFLASWGIGADKQAAVRAAQAAKAAQDLDRAIQAGCFREVDGEVYDTRKAQSGWVTFRNVKIFQIVDDGALIDTTPGAMSLSLIFLRHLPDGVGDRDFISFTALPDGTYSYINKADDARTVRQYDFGRICSRDEIPATVLSSAKAYDVLPHHGKPEADVIAKLPESDDLVASGSGFFVSTDGHFITNDHVVRNAHRVKLKIGERVLPAQVLREDATNDLALLKVDGEFSALALCPSNAALGQAVFTIGFPDISLQGTEPKFTDGRVSSLAGLKDDPMEYQISVPVQPGNSGGPLVDQSGNVRGVIVARLDDIAALRSMGSLPQNVNYAIKGGVLRDFLAKSPEIKLAPESTTATGAVDKVREAVAIVLVY